MAVFLRKSTGKTLAVKRDHAFSKRLGANERDTADPHLRSARPQNAASTQRALPPGRAQPMDALSTTFTSGLLGDPLIVALIFATFLMAGIVKGIIGLGLPIVVLAMLAATLGLKEAMALLVVPGVVMNIWQALAGPAFFELLRRFWSLWLVSIAAIGLGTTALAFLDPRATTIALGIVLSLYAGLKLSRFRMPTPGRAEPWLSPIIGALAGFLFGATGTYMVPGVLYIEAVGLKRDAFVQALGMTFFIITASLGVGLFANKLLSADLMLTSTLAIVPAVVGMMIGGRIRRHVPEESFRRLLFIWLAITGVIISARAYLT